MSSLSAASNASVVLKVSHGPQMRRVLLNDRLTIEEVHSQVRTLFPDVREYTLTYVDEEGDVITVMTDEEVAEAVKRTEAGPRIRLTLSPSLFRVPSQPLVQPCVQPLTQPHPFVLAPPSFLPSLLSLPPLPPPVPRPGLHPAPARISIFAHPAVCDGCGERIFEVRYKCSVCPNFDLYEKCEATKRAHPLSHAMLKLTRESAFSHLRSHHSVCHDFAGRRVGHVPRVSTHSPSSSSLPSSHGQVHAACCDNCCAQIVGVRYKCLSCEDYDLCRVCVARAHEVHPQNHAFAVIRRPHRSKASLLRSYEIFLPSEHAPSSAPSQSPAPAPAPAPSQSPAPAPAPAPEMLSVPPPSEDAATAPLEANDVESDDRRECRSILVALGIADSVVTDLMEQFGANTEAILNVVDEQRDD